MFKLFVTCPSGVEGLLLEELKGLGIEDASETITGVLCHAELESAYRVLLWSRLANRVLLVLSEAKSGDKEQLYEATRSIAWESHLKESDTFRVDFAGSNDDIRHTQFGARVVKDAIVDRFREQGYERPNVDTDEPMHRINVRLSSKTIYIALDLAGESLHKRGYRTGKGLAPIKENLAAALILRAGWPKISANQTDFIDPMCGSATFLIEAAMIAADVAPSALRKHFAVQNWLHHDAVIWDSLRAQVSERKEFGIARLKNHFYGCEIDANVVKQARENIDNAGFSACITIANADISGAAINANGPGLILSNPPYGMRLGEPEKLSTDYFTLAQSCKKLFSGWTLSILSSDVELLGETRLRADKKYKIFNGPIPCELRVYQLRTRNEEERANQEYIKTEAKSDVLQLSEGATMVANRLKKNIRKLKNWKNANNIECYRVYDADLPEYSAAIDVYQDRLHIQEYQAPKTIDEKIAKQRFVEIENAARSVFDVSRDRVFTKTRKRNRGFEQYQKNQEPTESQFFTVVEGKAKLRINLDSYLDTGLFLDHRPLRLLLAKEARGKRFLNLFSYTSTATVHAVLGGAISSTSVDMSNTYIDWSKKNFEENNIRGSQHQLIRADVSKWLKTCREGFDLIMLDPPSFSNSKKMDTQFDVQRDHYALIVRCMDLLRPGGSLYFSNNFRKFKLDERLSASYTIENITERTVDMDFERNKKIHYCFKIQAKR